jgi:3-hydroxy acid dehydrogenase / malonic semialdehyde reductase
MQKKILITGATAGFGKAIAKKFAAAGFNIIITGRRAERLQELQENLQSKYGMEVLPLCFDVQDKTAVDVAIAGIPADWQDIDILVNNAGLALGRDFFDEAHISDWETMLQTNVNGLLYVSKAVLPYMIARGSGHIINMGSIAGKQTYQMGNVYCASKAAVDSISRAMRVDLLRHSIKVTVIQPGAAETEFALVRYKGDAEKAAKTYTGITPLSAEDVADAVFYTATLPPHVCINELEITCLQQGSAFYSHSHSK